MNKKGQWVHAQVRDQNSAKRVQRMELTKTLAKQGISPDEIAIQIGVSGNTVRQYIRELKPIIEEELNYDKLSLKLNKLLEEISKLGSNLNSKKELTNFMNKYQEALKLSTELVLSAERLGWNTNNVRSNIIEVVKSGYSTLYSAIVTSVKETYSNPQNAKKIKKEEIEIIQKELSRWFNIKEKHQILKEDYKEFLEKVNILQEQENVEKLKSIVDRIIELIDLDEQIKTFEKSTKKTLTLIDEKLEDVPTSGMGMRINSFVIHILCNIFIPGLGTLIYARKQTKKIVIGILQLFWIFIPQIWVIFWLWAWIYSITIRKELDS